MPTFHIEQFGCRATQADGAAIERQLLDRGCTLANSSSAADVVVLNTCTVTAAADAQARDAIRKLHAINPAAQIIVTGCYAQRAPEELAALPGVSVVVGNSHKPQIPDLIAPLVRPTNLVPANFIPIASLLESQVSFPVGTRQAYRGPLGAMPVPASDPDSIRSLPRAAILVGNIFDQHQVLVAPVLGGESNHTRPTLKIQDGCNNRCSFCVIPLVRGKSRSLPLETVLQEIRNLSDSGYQEIVLSGINLGAWGRDLSPRQNFLDLLRQILDETEVARLRLSSIEPLDVTRDLVALFESSARLAQHFHMPLQSAADRVLAAMHRWYRSEHYARRIDFIREQLPHAGIGADVIAGFPGETEDDHAATMNFIASRPFTYLHVFSYSARPGTGAANLPDHLSGAIVKRRARELRELSEKKSTAFHRSQSGRTLSLLTLRHSDSSESSQWTPALSSNFLKLRLSGSWPPNQFVDAICCSGSHSVSVQKRPAAHLELI
ncbi:MAG TPA: tRNA (N(6)-L-threonylcarbamoyladenosine(37)-C(2))-methylthiotransferase MtaB [Candidatus Acidoferrum sp.]|nr:tRNA (N(6)-L-threonylcarbamoyladenosine(37)-C(2))-methylthiotransferase MtaB [Candidatus Acidoferrum sp.]